MKNGPYELVVAPIAYTGKKYRGRYCYEHHLVWWLKTGEMVPKGYEIHHLNGNHRDNNVENLKLLTSQEHSAIHAKLNSEKAMTTFDCDFCGDTYQIRKGYLREKTSRTKGNKAFCSRSCAAKNQFRKD